MIGPSPQALARVSASSGGLSEQAFLLADDTAIADPSITHQIRA
ncbi:hypothetical protein SAMN05216276_1002307 [Streptosporangium subroseum]|uniref:Uncharacterized protein n=1 Tax=Streptosporangium subroseum TaxID=106412 RepID=A0A239B1R9_9ACTN|nr:hypothetical protein SAMN05216276_1002307 [Streptosporangium subroseum]